ncbi:cupin domain-containing protein [Tenacibaculum xiamenense]|uniref:cupin n=1 Tax=Tenacibaculum xiamenense TaxID=1261553 RepID=UPI003892CD72
MKIANIFKDITYSNKKPIITVLLDTDFTKEIRIAMEKGTVMKEHKTLYPIVLEILEGTIDFGIPSDIVVLSKGDLIALESNVPHDLKANENSIIRLTLTKHDNVDRVEKVLKS